jgi:hypothetical protein
VAAQFDRPEHFAPAFSFLSWYASREFNLLNRPGGQTLLVPIIIGVPRAKKRKGEVERHGSRHAMASPRITFTRRSTIGCGGNIAGQKSLVRRKKLSFRGNRNSSGRE